MKSMGMLSTKIRFTAASFVFRPFMVHKTATTRNVIDNRVTGDNQPINAISSELNFNNTTAARYKEGMVTMSPADVIIGEDILSKSQFLL
jgi:hypothetical protein